MEIIRHAGLVHWSRPLLRVGISLICILHTVAAEGQDSSDDTDEKGSSSSNYHVQRQNEDWRHLRDPSKKDDYLDFLKYVRLGRTAFLTLGGEARPFFESYRNERWGDEPPSDHYLLQRYTFHVSIEATRFRVFTELKSGIETGRAGSVRVPDENTLDVHQAFVDLRLPWEQSHNSREVLLRVGRQELAFGAHRLTSIREGRNVRRSFDAIRAHLIASGATIDAFVSKPARTSPNIFDDVPEPGTTFWGVYGSASRLWKSDITADVYYFGQDRAMARFEQGSGRENRHSAGIRVADTKDPLTYDLEGIYQFGSFADHRIAASYAAARFSYLFAGNVLQPRLGVSTTISSGDSDPSNDTLGTFNPLYPRGEHFGLISAMGPANYRDIHPRAEFQLTPHFTVQLDWIFAWRSSSRDALYTSSLAVLRTGNLSRKRFVGHTPAIEMTYDVGRHITLNGGYAKFVPGTFLQETPPNATTNYIYLWVRYRF